MHEIPNLPSQACTNLSRRPRSKPEPNSPSRKKPLTAARLTEKTETPAAQTVWKALPCAFHTA